MWAMAQDKQKHTSPTDTLTAAAQLKATLKTRPEGARVVLVANLKGGTGKTTVSTHLAARLANEGHVTALLDLDPQHSALRWLARVPSRLFPTTSSGGCRIRLRRIRRQ